MFFISKEKINIPKIYFWFSVGHFTLSVFLFVVILLYLRDPYGSFITSLLDMLDRFISLLSPLSFITLSSLLVLVGISLLLMAPRESKKRWLYQGLRLNIVILIIDLLLTFAVVPNFA